MYNTRNRFEEAGQAMVEYVLLISVMVVIIVSLFTRLNDFFLNDSDSLQNRYLRGYQEIFSGGEAGLNGQYRRFRVLK